MVTRKSANLMMRVSSMTTPKNATLRPPQRCIPALLRAGPLPIMLGIYICNTRRKWEADRSLSWAWWVRLFHYPTPTADGHTELNPSCALPSGPERGPCPRTGRGVSPRGPGVRHHAHPRHTRTCAAMAITLAVPSRGIGRNTGRQPPVSLALGPKPIAP